MKHRIISLFILLLLVIGWSSCRSKQSRERRKQVKTERQEGKERKKNQREEPSKPYIVKTYSFDLGTETYSIDLNFEEDLVDYFAGEPKVYTYSSSKIPDDWEVEYYNMFIENDKDENTLLDIIDEIKQLKRNMSDDELLQFVVAFVQGGMEYDWTSYYNVGDKLNYPYETLFSKKGVCSDKSLLLGKLLTLLDYEIIFMTFEKANHMSVGLKVPEGYGNLGTDFAFVESTSYSSLGSVPKEYAGGIKIEESPKIIRIKNSGRKTFNGIAEYKEVEKELQEKYGDSYTSSSALERGLLEDMANLKTEIEELKERFEGCEGVVSSSKMRSCTKIQKKINRKVDVYNIKVEEYNALNNKSET